MSSPTPPVVVTTDKSNYNPGDPITVTVEYQDPDNPGTTLTVTAVVTNPDGSTAEGTVDVTVGGTPAAPLNVAVTDGLGDQYTQSSSEPGTAVFTGTVGTPPGA